MIDVFQISNQTITGSHFKFENLVLKFAKVG